MCKNACEKHRQCVKNCTENIANFFKQEHTPLENGLLVATAILGGIVLGMLCAPERSIQLGSANHVTSTVTPQPKKA